MARNHPCNRYILSFITVCLLPIAVIAQTVIPDPTNTYGDGTTIRITTSTNSETFITETKTEFFDKNGTLREENVQTKDLDGNSVKITKKYRSDGTLKETQESRSDSKGNTVYWENLLYDDTGTKITWGRKQVKRDDGTWFDFRFDTKKQNYKDGVIFTSLTPPVQDPNQAYCNCPRLFLNAGYSYLKINKGENSEEMPFGIQGVLGYRLNDRVNLIFDVSGHRRKENDQTFSIINLLGGVQYEFTDCDEQDRISLFSRVMLGMMREHSKYMSAKSSGEAFAGALGAGVDVKLNPKFSLRINADWLPSFFNSDMQNSFRIGGGLKFNLKDCP